MRPKIPSADEGLFCAVPWSANPRSSLHSGGGDAPIWVPRNTHRSAQRNSPRRVFVAKKRLFPQTRRAYIARRAPHGKKSRHTARISLVNMAQPPSNALADVDGEEGAPAGRLDPANMWRLSASVDGYDGLQFKVPPQPPLRIVVDARTFARRISPQPDNGFIYSFRRSIALGSAWLQRYCD